MSEHPKRPGPKSDAPKRVFEVADSIWKNGEGRVPELSEILSQVKGTTQTICDTFQDWSARRLGTPLPSPVPSALAKALASHIEQENRKCEAHWRDVVEALRRDINVLSAELKEDEEKMQGLVLAAEEARAWAEQLKGQILLKDELIDRFRIAESEALSREMSAKLSLVESDKEREFVLRHANALEQDIDLLKRERDRYREDLGEAKVELATLRAALDARHAEFDGAKGG